MPFNEFDPDPLLIDRYLAGDATEEERQAVEQWVRANPDAPRDLSALYTGIVAEHGVLPTYDHSARVAAVVDYSVRSARRSRARETSSLASKHWTTSTLRRARAQTPAIISWITRLGLPAMVCVGILWFVYEARRQTDHVAKGVQYATTQGQQLATVLPDGSHITLAPQSQVRYSVDNHGARLITLSGRAYFSVTHDPHRPFTVQTGAVHTQVLGTTFDVRHYPDDSTVQIVVVEGRVAARGREGRGAPVLLVAGTEGRLTDSTALIVTNRKTEDTEAWMRGRLVFDDTPVAEMLRTLQRWYGYEFRLTDSTLAQRQVTTMFSIGDTTRTLARLKTLLDVTMRFEGSVIVLVPVRHAQRNDLPMDRHTPFSPSQSEVGK